MTATIESRFGRGLNARKHFAPPPEAKHLGAHLSAASFPDVFGSWQMLDAVGGIGDQGQTSRCLPFATAKNFGLFQYGQSGTPVEFSEDWIYDLVLSEIRRMELGGSPTMEQLLANPLQDNGSEPSAADAACKRIGIAPQKAWPTGVGFSPKEMDLGGAVAGELWLPEAAGFTSVVATPGPALTQAGMAACMPFASGKLGQSIRTSIGSSTPGFENADGSRPLLAADLNQNYDHAVCGSIGWITSAVYEQLLGRQLTSAETSESPTARWAVLANSWKKDLWGQFTKLPELDANGKPTGNTIAFPGVVLVSETAFWGMADFTTVAEVSS